jgi:hypothetical protein
MAEEARHWVSLDILLGVLLGAELSFSSGLVANRHGLPNSHGPEGSAGDEAHY